MRDIYNASFDLTCFCARVPLHLLSCLLLKSLLTGIAIVIAQQPDILLVGLEHAILHGFGSIVLLSAVDASST